MFKPKNILSFLCALLVLGISVFLPATAFAETTPLAGAFTASTATASTSCPTGGCKLVPAEWVPGASVTAVTGGSEASTEFVKETPVSKLKEIKKSYEKKYKVVVGYYQNPNGWQGPQSECVKIEKVKAWHTKPGDYIHTTDHVGHGRTAKLRKGEKICHFHPVHINGHVWIEGTEGICSNVHTRFPIEIKIRKPRRVYVQFPTVEKFYEIAIKRLGIKSEAKSAPSGATAEIPGHWTCKTGELVNGNMCKVCPPPTCEPGPEPCCEEQPPCCEEQPPCCEEQPCTSCEPAECCVKFGNEFEFEEAHPDEPPIHYWIDIFAPKGHNLTIYFETEKAHFEPHEIKVPSYGAQSKFESLWFAPSHTGQFPVWVKVVDHTSGEICKSEVQWVTVLPWELEEPPT